MTKGLFMLCSVALLSQAVDAIAKPGHISMKSEKTGDVAAFWNQAGEAKHPWKISAPDAWSSAWSHTFDQAMEGKPKTFGSLMQQKYGSLEVPHDDVIKQAGWCVDGDGNSPQKRVRAVHNENQCWEICNNDKDVHACAFSYDTSHCFEYLVPAAKGNGDDGFSCWIKEVAENLKPPHHACLSSCPVDAIPTCSTWNLMIGAGGCAFYCPDAVKERYGIYICGRKPACAATCPEDSPVNCGFWTSASKEGGCLSTCSEELKLEFKSDLCGYERPKCAESCAGTDDPVLTCSMYKSYVNEGGCASNCSRAEKDHYQVYFCRHRPYCAADCPEDWSPTCASVENYTGHGMCASNCSDKLKLAFHSELCGVTKPECAKTCDDSVTASCSEFKVFTEEGNCAGGCSDAQKKHYAQYVCGRVPLCAAKCTNQSLPTCDSVKDMLAAGGCAEECDEHTAARLENEICHMHHHGHTYHDVSETAKHRWGDYKDNQATDIEEAEGELEKLDKMVSGAEAQAGESDTTHTQPPLEVENDEEGGVPRAVMAMGLLCVCCFWCGCCFAFHKWAFAKNGKNVDGDEA